MNLSVPFGNPSPESTEIPLLFEEHLRAVVGDDAMDLPNNCEELEMEGIKGIFLRYLKYLDWAIRVNANGIDNSMMNSIDCELSLVKNAIKKAKQMDEIYLHMIEVLGSIAFFLLGGEPHNQGKSASRGLIRKQNFILNDYRSVYYTQNSKQKARIIYDYVKDSKTSASPSEMQLILKQREKIKDDEQFVDWVKMHCQAVYLELF